MGPGRRRAAAARSARAVRPLVVPQHAEVVRSPARRPGWAVARVASYGLALGVHLGTVLALLDRVAAEIGVEPVDAVVVSGEFNAAYGTVGPRRRVLHLGLPLWESLTAQQKVALLGHEFAHGANGDSRHGVVVGTSLATLARLHAVPAEPAVVMEPEEVQRIRAEFAADYDLVARRLHDDAQERLHRG